MRPLATLVLACMLTVPLWSASAGAASSNDAGFHWALAWGRAPSAEVAGHAQAAVACALGDINKDSIDDLALRVKDEAGARLQALAGPDHTRVLWDAALEAGSLVQCAPDALADGIGDPLVILKDAASRVPADGAPVASTSGRAALQALDGATGAPRVALEAEESVNGAGAGPVAGTATTRVALEPGGPDLYLYAKAEEKDAMAALPLEEILLSANDARVALEALDATGKVIGTIEPPMAQANILAHAAVSDAEGARVILLSATKASPFDQVPAQTATLSAHATDGSILWTADLGATTDAVLLVPRAGDLDGDGLQDVIAETLPGGVDLPTASTLRIVSGASGQILLERATESGLLAALPLGDLTPKVTGDAEAVLVITQASPDASLLIECVREASTCWNVELPANAVPLFGAIDPYTGDLKGAVDITGDGVVDLATMVVDEASTLLEVRSGVDGSLAWSATLDAVAEVRAAAREGGADLVVLGKVDGARKLTLSLLDGLDGKTLWSVATTISSEIPDPTAHLDLAMDAAGRARSAILTLAPTVDAEASAEADVSTEHVYEVDLDDGAAAWSGSTLAGAAAPPELLSLASVAGSPAAAETPMPGIGLVLALVAAIALLGTRRRE